MEAMNTTETIDLSNDSHVIEKPLDELKNNREIKRKQWVQVKCLFIVSYLLIA